MKVEIVRFENQRCFKEYAVRYRRWFFSPWRWLRSKNDNVSLFKWEDAVNEKKKLMGEPVCDTLS